MMEIIERKLVEIEKNEYVLSDGSPDRSGDIIEPAGWQISSFSPIALFNHQRSDIIGKWDKVRVEQNELRGRLSLATPGTSPIVDMARALFDQGLLDTVSVGFRPLASEPIDGKDRYGPQRYTKAELIEASLVSVPANPRARRIAKQFLPESDYRRLCAASGVVDDRQRDKSVASKPSRIMKGSTMEGLSGMPIGKRIEVTQTELVNFKDRLKEIEGSIGEAPSAEQELEIETLSDSIDRHERNLGLYRKMEEKQKAMIARDPAKPKEGEVILPKEWTDRNKARPFDLISLVLAADFVSKATFRETGRILPISQILTERSKTDPRMAIAVYDRIVEKTAVNPAFTTVAGWAAELVQTVNADFLDVLAIQSIYGALSAAGQRFTFGRNGVIKIPIRANTPTINGSFVGEGQPIPVRRAGFTSTSLTPKKMAVISTFSREIDLHSIPAIQAVIRQAIINDTSNALDAVLISTAASSAISPAGLRATENNPVTVTASAATASYDKMIADLKGLINAIVGNGGDASRIVFIMNPAQAISLQWVTLADGSFPFQSVTQGQIRGNPVIVSRNIAAGTIIAVDASEFASVTDDTPQFDVNDSATLHEEDTTPLPITAGAGPNPVAVTNIAAPVRSLWQTYSAAIRMILPMNWIMMRNGGGAGLGLVALVTGITW
jgi:HK97 family phage prohead protease